MTKSLDAKESQLSLELKPGEKVEPADSAQKSTAKISSFIDARTMRVRRDAVERVISSGIFNLAKRG